MYFSKEITDKNGIQLQIGDTVVHVANPDIKGKIINYEPSSTHYLGSSWVNVVFEHQVEFSGNPGRKSLNWTCSSCLLEKK